MIELAPKLTHGAETNVLVRYLAQDDAIQSRQATQVIERQLTLSGVS